MPSITLTTLVLASWAAGAAAEAVGSAPAPTTGNRIIRPQASSYNYAMSGLDWNGTCKTGLRQSPININPDDETILTLDAARRPNLSFGTGKNVTVYNTGHTVQVQWVTDMPSNATVRLASFLGQPNITGPIASLDQPNVILGNGDDRLSLKPLQWHVHTPSEHFIDGRLSAMEAHLVTAMPQTANFSFCPKTGCLAVYGVLYDLVRNLSEPDTFLAPFFDNIPTKIGLDRGTNISTPLIFNDFFPKGTDFITYPGSLTTPPCTENVLWTVMTTPRRMSIGQLAQLQVALGTTEGEDECYRANEGTTVMSAARSRTAAAPRVSETSNDSSVQFVLCAAQGQRTNDRFPQPINNRTVWTFQGQTPTA